MQFYILYLKILKFSISLAIELIICNSFEALRQKHLENVYLLMPRLKPKLFLH